MKKIILIIAVCFSLNVFSTPSATILEEVVNYKINTDNTVVKHVYQKIKLKTPVSYNYFGEWFYTFNPELEKVNIIKSRTIKEDGSYVDTPENGILIQSPYATENAYDFSNYREYMVSHIGLEPNCVIEFEYEIVDLKPHKTYLFERMGGHFPVLKKSVFVDGEFVKEFHSDIVKKEGKKYSVEKLPYYNLDYHVSNFEQIPYLVISLKGSLETLKTLFKLNDSDNFKKAIKVLKLKNDSSKFQIAEIVKEFVNKKLVNVGLAIEKTGYTRRSIDKIVNSGFATKIEKAFVAYSILDHFNVNPDLTFVYNENKGDFLIEPMFQVKSEDFGEIYPNNLSYYGKTLKSLDGLSLDVYKGKKISVSIELEENTVNGLQGKIYVEGENLSSTLSASNCDFIEKGKIKNEKITQLKENKQVLVGDYLLKMENGRITLKKGPEKTVNLENLFYSLINSTSLEFYGNIQLNINLNIVFLNEIEGEFKKAQEIVNNAGKCEVRWVINGKTLSFKENLKLNKGNFKLKDFKELKYILAPLLDKTAKVAFLSKKIK